MEKSEDAKDCRKPGWDTDHAGYACADGAVVHLRNSAQRNGIRIEPGVERARVLVSGLYTCRDIAVIVRGAKGVKEVVFPRSVRTVAKDAFRNIQTLRWVVANEGLQELNTNPNVSRWRAGPFSSSQIERIRLPSTLRWLENRALAGCCHLKNVGLVEGLKEIGSSCFSKCDVRRLLIPASVRGIEGHVIEDCKNLKCITFAENSQLEKVEDNSFASGALSAIFVMPGMQFELEKHIKDILVVRMPFLGTVIGNCALSQLRSTKEVELPEGLETVGEGWFADSGVEKVTIPASVKTIQKCAFACCDRLEEVQFAPGSVLERIGQRSFCDSGLRCFSVQAHVTVLDEGAFRGCEQLSSVTFQGESELETIGEWCFCVSGLTSITIPRRVKTIQRAAFKGCDALEIVAFQDGSALEDIGPMAFQVSGLKQFQAPSSLRTIGKLALHCRGLVNVQFQEGLETIDDDCLSFTHVKQIAFPMSLRKLGDYTSSDNSEVTFYVAEGTDIGDVNDDAKLCLRGEIDVFGKALSDLRELRALEFPEGLERVGSCWFQNSGIEQVVVPASVREIGSYAFRGCEKLCSVIFLEGSRLEKIEGLTFYKCKGLNAIDLPPGVRSIGQGCFNESGLGVFVLPESVTELGKGALYNCKQLKFVRLNNSLRVIRDGCLQRSSVERVVIPKNLEKIEEDAFSECKNLKCLILVDAVETSVKESRSSEMAEVTVMPESLREIGYSAFGSCSKLENIVLNEGLEVIGDYAFHGSGVGRSRLPSTVRGVGIDAFDSSE